jgi:hypothetical protein
VRVVRPKCHSQTIAEAVTAVGWAIPTSVRAVVFVRDAEPVRIKENPGPYTCTGVSTAPTAVTVAARVPGRPVAVSAAEGIETPTTVSVVDLDRCVCAPKCRYGRGERCGIASIVHLKKVPAPSYQRTEPVEWKVNNS